MLSEFISAVYVDIVSEKTNLFGQTIRGSSLREGNSPSLSSH